VANKRFRTRSSEAAGSHVPDGVIHWPFRAIDWNVPTRIEWPSGERVLLFEIDVRRPSRRRVRVRGPNGIAWALFAPGTDGGWRPRSSAVATGVAGGTTQTKFPEAGVWALVLFHDGLRIPRGAVEISFGGGEAAAATPFLAEAHELRRFVLVSLALAFILAFGEAGRLYLLSGNVWTTWCAVPLGTLSMLFPVSFAVTLLWHTWRNIRVLRGEEPRRTPGFANRPLRLKVEAWPSVTIQIPVFREGFEDVIRPTLDAAREAARRYREETGARCNVLVCDDGLLYFARNDLEGALAKARRTGPAERTPDQAELLARTAYYEEFAVGFVGRPYPEPGVPGTERAGRFRKASNLNYALRLADRLEGGEPLSEAHAHFREKVPEHVYELGRWHGDVQVGDIIVQLDKDSVMPPDVIRATVPEFLDDPTLAYTQHASYPTNEERYFSVVVGWFTRLLYDLAIPSKCLIPGALTPLMGHNIFLRRSDLLRVGAWYEHAVCEDLVLCLRLHESGRHGKYIAYPGHQFGEAVTRIYTEELEKFRRYAFGAAEAVLNPISEWEHRGILTESWRRFCRSEHVRWYQVVDLFQFFFSLVNLASLVPISLVTGLGYIHPYQAVSMALLTFFIFGLVPTPAIYLLRRRGALAAMPAGGVWATRFGACKAIASQIALSFMFVGTSIAITRGALGHLFNRPIVFSATNTDDIGRASRLAHLREPSMRGAARDALVLLSLCAALALWRFYLNPTFYVRIGFDSRFHLVWLIPLAITALCPWIFHPYFVAGGDLPMRRSRAPMRAAEAPRFEPQSAEQAATGRRGAA
jgi:cellulose synthase/poly-beta-1,6-N-acetylglucosamine synthase-like glycosyltransferase